MRNFNISLGYRIVLVVVIFITVLTSIIYFLIRPTSSELLSKGTWCVDRIYYQNVLIGPSTKVVAYMQDVNDNAPCMDMTGFRTDGRLELPGINSYAINGTWKMDEDGNLLMDADSIKNVFNGKYEINVTEQFLQLRNGNTTILAHRDNYTFANPLNDLLK
ncbi:hypothetical protein [Mucilaginibacter psychrotolerans]|uniref:Uncharacterized protein n=1 Tax=Mucilaginibacter psychrotolerans TaxID=1524096 RepID=A0A4Y8SQT5_9SPHI|nr:hypothetical protein [Mucilaginibacter psychrotolerans]TFF40975.1 hypothetical protein E2R66_02015 [Mucilaginibacter psychrotolerans]